MTDEEDDDFEKKKAEAVKEKFAEKAAKEADLVDFTVYDVPVELKNQYISMAKLHYDNKVSKVLEDAMEALKEENTSRVDELEERVQVLESKVATMKAMQSAEPVTTDEEDSKVPPTFGDPNPDDNGGEENHIDTLKEQFGDTQ